MGVVRRYDIDRHWDRPGQRAAARPDQTRLLDKNGVHDRRLFHHHGCSGRCRFSRNSSADPIMGMADCPEFVGRSPVVGAGGVAAAVEKTRTRKSVRSETSANRGRLAFAAGMAGHTVHGAERDAFLCRRRLAADHSDGPWHIPGLILAATLRRLKDQKLAAATVSLLTASSLIGLIYAPDYAMLWAAVLGFGYGASMMLGLTFIGLRTKNAGDTAALSGMAQCVGYLMAAAGPLLLGQLHDWTGGWTGPLLITAAISVAGAFTGMLAGRNVQLESAESSSRTSPAIQSANALTAGDKKR